MIPFRIFMKMHISFFTIDFRIYLDFYNKLQEDIQRTKDNVFFIKWSMVIGQAYDIEFLLL